VVREVIAGRIIAAAKLGERDPVRLRAAALRKPDERFVHNSPTQNYSKNNAVESMMGIGSVLKYQFMAPGERARSWQLIRLAKFPNVIDRKRILSRHSRAEVAPLRRANTSAFHRLFGALNDFADWLAIGDRYKNVRISRH
jgi:hypothetical protein